MSAEKPNILIIMVDQLNGTFFPDGPAEFLHAPNLKALAARDNEIPFYVALPGPTIDWDLRSGDAIPIEQRAAEEVTTVTGLTAAGQLETVMPYPIGTKAANFGFDVTPARLVTRFITERGVAPATKEGLLSLYPEKAPVRNG